MALLQEIQVPLLAVNDTTLTVVEMGFVNGGAVKKGDVIMVFETSKTTYDVEATADGFVQYLCEVDREYEVNTVVARVYSEVTETASAVAVPVPAGPASAGPVMNGATVKTAAAVAAPAALRKFSQGDANWQGETLFSKEAMRLIVEGGLAPSMFAGRDLVSAGDVKAFLKPVDKKPVAARAATLPVDTAKVIVERLSSGKKREIEYLGDVQAPGLTSTLNTYFETDGIFTHINKGLKYLKDSLLPVIVYEVSRLLEVYPLLNAYYTGDAIARYKEVNPGFAVDIDKGLKVLKVAGAGRMGIQEIEKTIIDLSGHYLDDALEVDHLTDITFTITDLSSEGVSSFRPLVNKMNSAILGVSAIDGKLQRCTLSLTFDHRVTEGKYAAQFLKELKDRLESYRMSGVARDISCFKCMKTLQEDVAGVGFARCVTPEGKDGYICQSCLKGF